MRPGPHSGEGAAGGPFPGWSRFDERTPASECPFAKELADVFDALTSVRPYKNAWTIEAAVGYIEENSGKHFDPELVAVFPRELPGIVAIRERFADPG